MASQDALAANRHFIGSFNLPMLVLSLCIAAYVLAGSHINQGYLIDGQGFVIGRDFVNFWHYGLAAWNSEGHSYHDLWVYNAVLDKMIPGYDYPDQNFSYPPHYMLLAAPFGLMGYNWALAIYTSIGLGLYWYAIVRPFKGDAERLALFFMPTFAIFLLCGQVSAFIAVLFVTIYRTLDTRPWIAAAMIALLTCKPQHGLLIPLFLLVTGRYRLIGYTALLSVAFFGLSVGVHGWPTWENYLTIGIRNQSTTLYLSNPVVLGLMPTAFVDMIILGAGTKIAGYVQAVCSVAVIASFVLLLRRTDDRFLQFSALIVATFLATPYLMAYDTLVLGWIMMTLATRFEMDGFDRMTYRLAMILCPLGVALAIYGLPGAPLVLVAVGWWIWKSVARENALSIAGSPAPAAASATLAPTA